MAANRSKINLPFKYDIAIFLDDVTSLPVIKSEIVVRKLKKMSIMNTASQK